jgi:hypothetical protein
MLVPETSDPPPPDDTTESTTELIEMSITGTLPPTGNLKPNLKASPSLFTHAKSAHAISQS